MSSARFIRFATTLGLILAMGAPGAARAQTSIPVVVGISGPVQSGASLTITGSGFGQKSVAGPLKYDNFEGGTTGSTVGNGWSTISGGIAKHPPIYSTTVTRANSTKSVQARFDDNGGIAGQGGCDYEGCQYNSSFGVTGDNSTWGALPNYIPGLTLRAIYADAWVYYAPANPAPRNVKFFRIHTNTYEPNMYYNIYCPASIDGSILAGDGGTSGQWLPDPPKIGSAYYSGNWRHIQFFVSESSPNVADGTVVLTIDGVTKVNRIGNFETKVAAGTFYNTFWFGNYMGHGADTQCAASSGNSYNYWDDAYIDTTRAHVEIGDVSTYTACTHREIQIPTSWSSNSITITANQGSFASLANTYMFVVDRNGLVNTIGYKLGASSSDLVSPAAIEDLRPRLGP